MAFEVLLCIVIGLSETEGVLGLSVQPNLFIVGTKLSNTPELAILNYWGTSKLDNLRKDLVDELLCAARMLILSSWKVSRVPSIREWYLKIWDLFLQDKISTMLLNADNRPKVAANNGEMVTLVECSLNVED